MVLRFDELRKTIARRTIDLRTVPGGRGHLLAVVLELTENPPQSVLDAIVHAGHQAAGSPIGGVIGPRYVEVGDKKITLLLDPVSNRAIRLDTLLAAGRHAKKRIGSSMAASIAITVANLLDQIHEAPGFEGEPRLHGEVHKGAVLLSPGGSVALLGPGIAPINAVLLPPLTEDVDRYRLLCPEAARGEPLDRRADVYSTAVLYYELLSGRPYLERETAALICQRAIEGRPPQLPAEIERKRPGLARLFERALAPNKDDRFPTAAALGDAIYDEIESSGRKVAGASELAALIQQTVPEDVGRGPTALLRADHDRKAIDEALDSSQSLPPVTIPADTPTRRVTPAEAGTGTSPPPALNDWGSVLSQEVTGVNKVPEIAAAVAADLAGTPHDAPTRPSPSAPQLSMPTPAAQGSTSKSDLPLPSDIGSGPTRGAAPSIDAAPFAALDSDDEPATEAGKPARPPKRTAKPVAIDDGSSKWVVPTIIGVVVIGLIGIIASVIWGGDDDPEPRRPDPIATVSVDASVAPAATRDGGTVTKAPPPPPPPTAPPPKATAVGYLSVMSTPSGASVELDGGYVGKTPLVLRHDFDQRYYRVTILADGHEPWERNVRPDMETKSINVIATLAPK